MVVWACEMHWSRLFSTRFLTDVASEFPFSAWLVLCFVADVLSKLRGLCSHAYLPVIFTKKKA